MESQPQNPEFRNYPEDTFQLANKKALIRLYCENIQTGLPLSCSQTTKKVFWHEDPYHVLPQHENLCSG